MARITDILIPEKGGTIGELVAKSLRGHGLRVEFFDDSPFGRDNQKYVRELKQTVEQLQPKAVMPIFKGELLARNWNIASVPLLCESADKLALLDDKVRCSALVAELGIKQPKMYADDETPGEWPVVFKRSRGLSGSSVYFPKSLTALDNLIRSDRQKDSHLVMEYIKGYDISVDAIRIVTETGEVHFEAIAYRTLWPTGKGISKIRLRVKRPDLMAYARKILDSVDYNGVCGIDFRIDRRTRKAYFMECNPRFSGGLKTSLAAGLDLPWLLFSHSALN